MVVADAVGAIASLYPVFPLGDVMVATAGTEAEEVDEAEAEESACAAPAAVTPSTWPVLPVEGESMGEPTILTGALAAVSLDGTRAVVVGTETGEADDAEEEDPALADPTAVIPSV